MTDVFKPNGATEITPEDKLLNAHEYLKQFINNFDEAKRGGIHDFIELTVFNMVSTAIKNIDAYLKPGHMEVEGTEIMSIVADSYQKVLDGVKRNLENLKKVKMR
jgi:hypothetical protein